MEVDPREVIEGKSLEFDVCIVGAGPAGITIAKTLPSSLRIALIEAGGFEYSPREQLNYSGHGIGVPSEYLTKTRARLFGGSSRCWQGYCRPLDAYDFEKKSWLADSVAWPISQKELIPFYDKASSLLGVRSFFGHSNTTQLLTSNLAVAPFHLSEPPMHFGSVFRDEIIKSKNISLFLSSAAKELSCHESGNAVKVLKVVNKAGARFKVKAKNFVLATGGIENARILLVSDARHRNGIGNEHDQLGRYFMCHSPAQGFARLMVLDDSLRNTIQRGFSSTVNYLTLSEAKKSEKKLLNAGFRFRSISFLEMQGDTSIERSIPVLNRALTGTKVPTFFSVDVIPETVPDRENRVRLSQDTDAIGMRKIHLNFHVPPSGLESMRRSLACVAQEIGRHSLGRLQMLYEGNPVAPHPDEHHMGTTRMHDDPTLGVVDRNCKVHGFENLYVAGSSVFTSCGFANPTFTILALAHRLSEHLAAGGVS